MEVLQAETKSQGMALEESCPDNNETSLQDRQTDNGERRKSDPIKHDSLLKKNNSKKVRHSSGHGTPANPASRKRSRSVTERSFSRSPGSTGPSPILPKKRCHGTHSWKGNKHSPRGKGRFQLPNNFLLGGNINDPLNLNSLNNAAVDQALNAATPVSSPLPTPAHRKNVEVLLPPNITDPLNLNAELQPQPPALTFARSHKHKRKKHRHKKKRRSVDQDGDKVRVEDEVKVEPPASAPLPTGGSTLGGKLDRVLDAIVSPVVPQGRKQEWPKRKRKRTGSESDDGGKKVAPKKPKSPNRPKFHRSNSNQSQASSSAAATGTVTSQRKDKNPAKFRYGNYNQYYGKRNQGNEEDHRLKYFRSEWFENKDVLDIGCNVGHVTYSVASKFNARRVVGMDIDGHLISVAKKNVRHYLADRNRDLSRFPVSCRQYGPITKPGLSGENRFPNNVFFQQCNYVPGSDAELEQVTEEYDCILALSVTKWFHLNNGDQGLKRAFKRMFRQLRPGGTLVLEPQSWASYRRRANLTEDIRQHYRSAAFKPHHFNQYLLSSEVGFSRCDVIDTPYNKNKGFQRPICVYTKSSLEGATPLPGRATPATPATQLKLSDSAFFFGSGSNTPWSERDLATPICLTPSTPRMGAFSGSSVDLDALKQMTTDREDTAQGQLPEITRQVSLDRRTHSTGDLQANTHSFLTHEAQGHFPPRVDPCPDCDLDFKPECQGDVVGALHRMPASVKNRLSSAESRSSEGQPEVTERGDAACGAGSPVVRPGTGEPPRDVTEADAQDSSSSECTDSDCSCRLGSDDENLGPQIVNPDPLGLNVGLNGPNHGPDGSDLGARVNGPERDSSDTEDKLVNGH